MEYSVDLQNLESEYSSYLLMERRVVGVKFYSESDSFDQLHVPLRKGKSFYCQMIKMAASGKKIKAVLDTFACDTAARMTGFKEYYKDIEDIDGWYNTGLYKSREMAISVKETIRPVKEKSLGLIAAPIAEFKNNGLDTPDIVLIACNPRQAMRLMQAYTYHYGVKSDLKITGQCGICAESSSLTIRDQDIRVSFLCSGTRYVCKWPDDIMIISFPFAMAENILNGLHQTAEYCEPDEIKKTILVRLKNHGLHSKKKLTPQKAYFYRRL